MRILRKFKTMPEPNNFQLASSRIGVWIPVPIFFARFRGGELKFQRNLFSIEIIPGTRCASPPLQPFLRLILYTTLSWKIWNDLGTLCPSLPGTPVRFKLKPPFRFLAGDISFLLFFFFDWCSGCKRLYESDLGKKQVWG